MRIKAAITDVKLMRPILNAISLLSFGIPVDFGGAAMEVEFIDDATGVCLGAVIARRRGSFLHFIPSILRSRGHTVAAFKKWVNLLREGFEEVDFPQKDV